MNRFKNWLWILFIVIVILFAAMNAAPVRVYYLPGKSAEMPLFLIITGAFAAGALTVWLSGVTGKVKRAFTTAERPESPVKSDDQNHHHIN